MTTNGNGVAARVERRRRPRAARLGRAMVHGDEDWAREYELANVSASGALLLGGPPLRSGRSVRVVLALQAMLPLAVAARVVRTTPDGMVAVEFVELETSQEDAIQQAVVCALSGESPQRTVEEPLCALPSEEEPPEEVVPSSWPGFALPRNKG